MVPGILGFQAASKGRTNPGRGNPAFEHWRFSKHVK